MNRPTPSWLGTAVFYEIYLQSFCDSNGDGIGDLPGVIQKLDYLQHLGCNALWISPCFQSPFGDAGYDVSDYCEIAPRYGSKEDLCRLFEEAHQRNMKVCLDLVAGHTSIEHPWFRESARPGKNCFSDWYVWTDSVWREAGPGLDSIRGYSGRDGQYVPNFFWFQPALNYGFQNPDPAKPWQLPTDHPAAREVRAELVRIMRYWLDLGADGFRVDMAASLVKGDPEFTGTIQLWQEIRSMFDRDYPEAALIAEWSSPKLAIQAGFHIDFMIHFGTEAYTALFREEKERDVFAPRADYGTSFFDPSGRGDIRRFLDVFTEHYEATRQTGYISLPSGNHDISRLSLGRDRRDLEVAFAFLLTMPGVPYLYYGDEIGMRCFPGLPSKEGGFRRTGSRTPMQWDRSPSAGFSGADPENLYLPLDPDPDRPTVSDQADDPDSLLHHVRSLLHLREHEAALGNDGGFEAIHAVSGEPLFVYLRTNGPDRILVAINPADRSAEAAFPLAGSAAEALLPTAVEVELAETRAALKMPPRSWSIFKLRP
jgi:glycosidase